MGWSFNPEWTLAADYQQGAPAQDFANLDAAFQCGGEIVTHSSLCSVSRVTHNNVDYYVKRYVNPAEGIARFISKSKARREWENLQLFAEWQLSPAALVAFGEESGWWNRRGIVVTEGIPGAIDMATLARDGSALLKNNTWVRSVCRQVAHATKVMHQHRFAHNDWKWRNILVNGPTESPKVHMIDCPAGTFWLPPFFEYRRIKDLACLDKVGKYQLTRSQRLYFFKQYTGRDKLNAKDKRDIRKILKFFKGRE